MSIEYDMLQELTDALTAQGGHYQVVLKVPEITLPETPGLIQPATLSCAALTDNNVILARTDINPQIFQWSNAQSGQFAAAVPFSTPFGTVVPLTRSWA